MALAQVEYQKTCPRNAVVPPVSEHLFNVWSHNMHMKIKCSQNFFKGGEEEGGGRVTGSRNSGKLSRCFIEFFLLCHKKIVIGKYKWNSFYDGSSTSFKTLKTFKVFMTTYVIANISESLRGYCVHIEVYTRTVSSTISIENCREKL